MSTHTPCRLATCALENSTLLNAFLMLTCQSMLTHTHYRLATCALNNSTLEYPRTTNTKVHIGNAYPIPCYTSSWSFSAASQSPVKPPLLLPLCRDHFNLASYSICELDIPHTGRKQICVQICACKPFDVACKLCEHPHLLQFVP